MHSFDERPTCDPLAAGRKLIEAIRVRGEPVQVDLGVAAFARTEISAST